MRFEKKSDFFGRGGGLVPLWHFVGSKSHLIIDQKSMWNARYYRFVVKKRSIFGGGGDWGRGLENLGQNSGETARYYMRVVRKLLSHLRSKSHFIISQTSRKNAWEKLTGRGGEGGGVLSICSIFCYQNYNRLSAKKLDIIGKKNRLSCGREGGILDYLIIELKKSKKYLILYRRKRKENKNFGGGSWLLA